MPRAGVDIDSIVTNVGMRDRRVAVNDKFSVVVCRIQKFVTDPKQIRAILLINRDVGTDAGVDEQEIATMKTVLETLQEQFVRVGKQLAKATMQIGRGVSN